MVWTELLVTLTLVEEGMAWAELLVALALYIHGE